MTQESSHNDKVTLCEKNVTTNLKRNNWDKYSEKKIYSFILKQHFNSTDKILNVSFKNNKYNFLTKINYLKNNSYNSTSIENIQYNNGFFNKVVCVGSVINYSDALLAISELSRVLSKDGELILEFESSFIKKRTFNLNNNSTKKAIYSLPYIKNILNTYSFDILEVDRFHILSSFHYNLFHNKNKAVKYSNLDFIFKKIVPFKFYSKNVIIKCKKK